MEGCSRQGESQEEDPSLTSLNQGGRRRQGQHGVGAKPQEQDPEDAAAEGPTAALLPGFACWKQTLHGKNTINI